MIAFRHTDQRFPFLRESASPQAGRWNSPGELTHYFCDTPDGAWAEFLRHEEITDPEDLVHIRRAIWAVDIGDAPSDEVIPQDVDLFGGRDSWSACQRLATERRKHASGLVAPAAALLPGTANGWRVENGETPGPIRSGKTIALFGPRPDLVGWEVARDGRPSPRLLERVRYL